MPRIANRVTDAQTLDAIGRLVRDFDAGKAAAAAMPPAPEPAPPDYFVVRQDPEEAGRTLYQAVGHRINDGLYRSLFSLCEYVHASSTEDCPCDIHEVEERVRDLAEMVRGVRELYLVPGVAEFLRGQPHDRDLTAGGP